MKFVFGMVENIVGKEENVGYPHFSLYPHNIFKGLHLLGC